MQQQKGWTRVSSLANALAVDPDASVILQRMGLAVTGFGRWHLSTLTSDALNAFLTLIGERS